MRSAGPHAARMTRGGRAGARRGLTRGVVLAALMAMAGCTPPGTLVPPPADTVAAWRLTPQKAAEMGRAPTRIQPGDTLRILRDAQNVAVLDIRNLVDDSQQSLYPVRPDGSFSFRYVGRVDAAGKTPDEVASEIARGLEPYYREPRVTVNIISSPSSRVVVGGAVRTPGPLDLNAVATLEQALFAAGGVLPSADLANVALLRLDEAGRYRVWFMDLASFLQPTADGRPTLAFQRGDILFVPQSAAGRAGDGVEVYFNQLLPFARSFGVSVTKDVR